MLDEKGKGAALLSLELKKRRTRAEIRRDKAAAEEEKSLANSARQLQLELEVLQSQKNQDELMIQSLNEELRHYKEPEPQMLLFPVPTTNDFSQQQNK